MNSQPIFGQHGRGRMRGFTLIELMITVAIVALLSAIALPAFTSQIKKGKRAEGRAALFNAMQAQERYNTQNGTYLAISEGTSSSTFKMTSGDNSTNPNYKLKAEACSGTTIKDCVLITAVQYFSDTEAGNLTLTSTGLKSCTGSKPSVCWP